MLKKASKGLIIAIFLIAVLAVSSVSALVYTLWYKEFNDSSVKIISTQFKFYSDSACTIEITDINQKWIFGEGVSNGAQTPAFYAKYIGLEPLPLEVVTTAKLSDGTVLPSFLTFKTYYAGIWKENSQVVTITNAVTMCYFFINYNAENNQGTYNLKITWFVQKDIVA